MSLLNTYTIYICPTSTPHLSMQCEFRLNCCMLVSTWPYLFRVRDCYFCIFLTLLAPWVTKHALLLVGTIVNIGFHWLRVPSLNTQLMLLFSWSIFGDYNPSFFPRYLHSFNLYLYSSKIVIMIKWKEKSCYWTRG